MQEFDPRHFKFVRNSHIPRGGIYEAREWLLTKTIFVIIAAFLGVGALGASIACFFF